MGGRAVEGWCGRVGVPGCETPQGRRGHFQAGQKPHLDRVHELVQKPPAEVLFQQPHGGRVLVDLQAAEILRR